MIKGVIMKMMVSASKKMLFLVGCCCMLGIIALLATAMFELYKTKDYKKVQGIITSVNKEIQYEISGPDNQMNTSIVRYVTCKYLIDGKEYTSRQRTFLKFGKHVNSSYTIYCDKHEPDHIRNQFLLECCVLGSVFFWLALVIILSAIKKCIYE